MNANPPCSLTIVIPTFNRPEKAQRALEYWAGRGFKILMLDGGESPMALSQRVRADPDITYKHMPEPLSQRLGYAARTVNTEYATLCGDDDFLLLSALRQCTQFLDEHADYGACGGQALAFSRGITGQPRAFSRYEKFRTLNISGATGRDRALSYFSSFTPATIYAVCRRDLWCRGMTIWSEKEFPIYAIGEIQFEFFMAYSGKIRRLPVLHWLRSHEIAYRKHQRSAKGDVSLSKSLLLPELWDSAAHAAMRSSMIAYTAGRIAVASGIPQDQVAADFHEAITAYLTGLKSTKDRSVLTTVAKIRQKLAKRLNRLPLPFWMRMYLLRRQGVECNNADINAVLASLR